MRGPNLLFSLSALLLGLLVVAGGLFLMFVSHAPAMHYALGQLVLHSSTFLAGLGLLLALLGIFLVWGIYKIYRRSYLRIKMGKEGDITVADSVITSQVKEALSSLFPEKSVQAEATVIRGKRVAIKAHLPTLPGKHHEEQLKEMEAVLEEALETCGCQNEFTLDVSFADQ